MLQVEWITANAGSGKTTYLLEQAEKLPLEEVLCITFSNAAADEINARLGVCTSLEQGIAMNYKLNTSSKVERKAAYTLHSFCFKLLLLYNSDYQILDVHTREILLKLANKCPEKLQKLKALECWLDFDDVLLQAKRLIDMSMIGEQLYVLLSRVRLICIDEAQDFSRLQWDVVFALLQELDQVKVVIASDEKQSIFGFQGACYATYRRAFQVLQRIEEVEFKHVVLHKTYRLPGVICDFVDRVFGDTKHVTSQGVEGKCGCGEVEEKCGGGEIERVEGSYVRSQGIVEECGGKVEILDCTEENWMQVILEKINYHKNMNKTCQNMQKNDSNRFKMNPNASKTCPNRFQMNPNESKININLQEEGLMMKKGSFCKILIKKRSKIYQNLANFLRLNNIEIHYGQEYTFLQYIKFLQTGNEYFLENINSYKFPTEYSSPLDLMNKLLIATKQNDDVLLEKAGKCVNLHQLYDVVKTHQVYDDVEIQTIYQSKGQEAELVFLCDTTINPKQLPNYDLEEHKRVLYVGLTRAKQWLYIVPVPFVKKLSETCWLQQLIKVDVGSECMWNGVE